MNRRRQTLVVLTLAAGALLPAAAANANSQLESMFQDDPRLLSENAGVRNQTLDTLKSLGVQRLRVTAFWNRLAPDATSTTKPKGFDGKDPNAYLQSGWAVYDDLIQQAAKRGIKINLNPTAPGPLWAGAGFFSSELKLQRVTNPDPVLYGEFVLALGKRYSGTFVPKGATAPLPRVDYWSIWNEPNQGGWLSPQWTSVSGKGTENSPQRYRALVDGGYAGLVGSGHQSDTILIGDTAPKGIVKPKAITNAMTPIRFIRRLYCVSDTNALLRGSAATDVGCPANPDPAQFAAQHPGLFKMTGWAHHPYELLLSPTQIPRNGSQFVTTANLDGLSDQLTRLMARYGQSRSSIPLYLTEYGYQTNPPDQQAVSLAKQAAYINQGEYIAWKNKSVRTLSQFLLRDDAPVGSGQAGYAATFQSGLLTLAGKVKPARDAYRVPFFVPNRTAKKGKIRIWGRVRPGTGARTVTVQWRPRTARKYRTLKSGLKTTSAGFVSKTVRVKSAKRGALRLSTKIAGKTVYSRAVSYKRK